MMHFNSKGKPYLRLLYMIFHVEFTMYMQLLDFISLCGRREKEIHSGKRPESLQEK